MGGWLLLKIGPSHHQFAERSRELPAPQTHAWRLPAKKSPQQTQLAWAPCLVNCSLKIATEHCPRMTPRGVILKFSEPTSRATIRSWSSLLSCCRSVLPKVGTCERDLAARCCLSCFEKSCRVVSELLHRLEVSRPPTEHSRGREAYQRANSALPMSGKESYQRCEGCAHAPRRLPVFWVVGGDGQADLGIGLKSPVGGQHHEGRGLEGVVSRQQYSAVVDAPLDRASGVTCPVWTLEQPDSRLQHCTHRELGLCRPSDDVVPLKDVVLYCLGYVLGRVVVLDLLQLLQAACLSRVQTGQPYRATSRPLTHLQDALHGSVPRVVLGCHG